MLRPVWSCILTILGVFIFHVGEVQSQCWESSKCTDLSSEDGILECIKACKMDLSAESPVFPGNGHMQPLSENIRNDNQNTQDGKLEEEGLDRQDNKRSYSMEHFRWGKPVGKKRRPIKVFPSDAEEDSSEIYPTEYRRELSVEFDYPETNSEEEMDDSELMESPIKKDRKYKMHHFRWEGPPKDKRYGGFMTPERSQTPLMTLFKNAIIKNAHKKGQ
ncbi:pro-opiomelanocortin isoform X2 [Rhinoderma darwinii]|uniref:pro-opiomelanocortin isoform X2 n=1 Tax=Rhinoderma darwinii TaxID=43563 RepID=UPI003F6633AA